MAEDILGTIVTAKKVEVAQRFAGVSLDALRGQARPTSRSLAAAIGRPGARFILEIKKASPSQGVIRGGADVAVVARGYAPVADALSVLTDHGFFGGSVDDLRTSRGHFDGPILAKDFFIDLRQVAEARIAGADAILVMLSVLNDEKARAMIAEARLFGMDALVEVHDQAEMRRALALDAPLIGINNRDLRDMSIDLSTTERLAAVAGDRLLVSESGIGVRADIDRLAGKVDGFLIGSALMRADDPALAARELVFGRVKLCGLNRAEDVAAGSAASFVGLVFVKDTPRFVSPETAALLTAQAREAGMQTVGVFRDETPSTVVDAARLMRLHAVQLHGGEDDDYIANLRRALPEACAIWKAVAVGHDPLISDADRLLFDNGEGGSGKTFDWSAVRDHPALARSIVAGGIGTHNAALARTLGAYAIDVGSSVDVRPGLKSPAKIAALFDALRAPSRESLRLCA